MEQVNSVPLLDLKAQLVGLREEIAQAVLEVVDSTQYIMGPKIQALEDQVASYTGAAYAIGVSSGTDALLLSLMGLDIGPGDSVITTDFSFFATAGVIARLHAKPIFVDIDPVTFNMDPPALLHCLESMPVSERQTVKAIMPVHLYGQSADLTPLLDIAAQYRIPVIEDAAQAIGTEYFPPEGPQRVGTMGDIGCFSFFPSKNLGGIGDGGMIVTQNSELAQKLRLLRVHGAASEYTHEIIGGNFRLDPIQAAVLSVKLPYLDQWHQARQRNANRYTALFQQKNVPEVKTPVAVYADQGLAHYHIYNQYMIRVSQRSELQAFLKERQIATKVYYPVPFHQQQCFRHLGYRDGAFPESEKAAQEVLALPIYPELTEAMQTYVVEAIADFYRN